MPRVKSYKPDRSRGARTDLDASVHRSSRRLTVARARVGTAERRVKRCQLRYLTTCTEREPRLSRLVSRAWGLDRGNDFMSVISHRALHLRSPISAAAAATVEVLAFSVVTEAAFLTRPTWDSLGWSIFPGENTRPSARLERINARGRPETKFRSYFPLQRSI